MASIKDLIASITAKLGEEMDPKVASALKSIQREADSLESEISTVTGESIERKKRLRKLEQDLEAERQSVNEWKEKAEGGEFKKELDELKAENASLKEFKTSVNQKTRKDFEGKMAKIVKSQKFEQAKGLFKIPEAAEGQEIDFSKMSEEDFEHNLAELERLETINYCPELSLTAPNVPPANPGPTDFSSQQNFNVHSNDFHNKPVEGNPEVNAEAGRQHLAAAVKEYTQPH